MPLDRELSERLERRRDRVEEEKEELPSAARRFEAPIDQDGDDSPGASVRRCRAGVEVEAAATVRAPGTSYTTRSAEGAAGK